jgi:hypothetical protein
MQRWCHHVFNVDWHGHESLWNNFLSSFNKFTTTCTVRLSFYGSGHTACTPENMERVRLAVQKIPRCSALRYATALNLSYRSIHHILHGDLGLWVLLPMLLERQLVYWDFFFRPLNFLLWQYWVGSCLSYLPAPDCYFMGCINERAFWTRLYTIQELKNSIRQQI